MEGPSRGDATFFKLAPTVYGKSIRFGDGATKICCYNFCGPGVVVVQYRMLARAVTLVLLRLNRYHQRIPLSKETSMWSEERTQS